MEDRKISILINKYDELLNSLKHISELKVDVDAFNEKCFRTSSQGFKSFLSFNVEDTHEAVVNKLIFELLGKDFAFNEVSDIKNYIKNPNFIVKNYVKNPHNFYENNNSIEQLVFAAPVYELNLITKNKDPLEGIAQILRIKRLELSSDINVYYIQDLELNGPLLMNIVNELASKFKERFDCEPNKNDLVFLTNTAIKAIIEKLEIDNSDDCILNPSSYVSFDYKHERERIMGIYHVYYEDSYKTLSNVSCPWIYKGIKMFDNRELLINDTPFPLSMQRVKRL